MSGHEDADRRSLLLAARAWEAMCRVEGADPGSPESREIARDVAAVLASTMRLREGSAGAA